MGRPPGFGDWVADMLGWGHPMGRAAECLNGGYGSLDGENISAVLSGRLENARKHLTFVNADKLTWKFFKGEGGEIGRSAQINVYDPLYRLIRECAFAGHPVSEEAMTIWHRLLEILPADANEKFLGWMNARSIEIAGMDAVRGASEQGTRRKEFVESAFLFRDEVYPLGIALLGWAGGSDFADGVLMRNLDLIGGLHRKGELPAFLEDRLLAPFLHVTTAAALQRDAARDEHGRSIARFWNAQYAEGAISERTRDRINDLIEERLGFDPARA